MEKLSHMILKWEVSFSWQPFKISRQGLTLSYLFFVDDLLLFAKATETQVLVVKDCLKQFSLASGLIFNLEKSKLFISPNIHATFASRLSKVCGIPLTDDLGKYLEVPLIHKRASKKMYSYIIDRIMIKLDSWKGKILSLVGMRILIQSTTSAILLYNAIDSLTYLDV
ncbi:hypothetical protein PVK06_005091 [Gossypium arboreum]|uniref:Reverse transcriptase domain-containing protein n=1 Tax=Gossypium arboreum TaxID=29729 RepID=A0ABR0QUP0_GOSAR|nr:hypothetical protein PVK06_005091 [Gossypium arboreum]